MKTTTLFLASLFAAISFTACVPGDPEILSPEERAAQKKRDEDFKNKNTPKPPMASVPNPAEMAGAILVEARHDHALQVLRKALELVKTNAKVSEEGCVRTELQADVDSVLNYKIQYQECPMVAGQQAFVFSGMAKLEMKMTEAGQIESISYSTPKLTDAAFSDNQGGFTEMMNYQLTGDNFFVVQDHVEILIQQTSSGVFEIQKNTSLSRIVQGKGKVTTLLLAFATDPGGKYTLKDSNTFATEFKSAVEGRASDTAGGATTFTLAVTKEAQSEDYRYVGVFNGNAPRDGKFEFNEEKAVMKPQSGKPKEQSRQKKGDSLDAFMPWDLWNNNPPKQMKL